MRKRTLISGAVIVLFLGLLTAFPLSWYLLPEEARQQTGENRALAEFPQLSLDIRIITCYTINTGGINENIRTFKNP